MKIATQMTDEAVLSEVGGRLARVRLDRNLLQAELAELAGVSKSTVERLEGGNSTQLSSFIRICRALDLIDHLDLFIPEPVVSPIAQLKLQGKQRRRASKPGSSPSQEWTWGTDK